MVYTGMCFLIGGPRHGEMMYGLTSCQLRDRSAGSAGYGAYFEYNRTIFVFRIGMFPFWNVS